MTLDLIRRGNFQIGRKDNKYGQESKLVEDVI